jgi:hypothetical protein
VLYLIFTEGHTATTGTGLTDTSLVTEAIRLTRRLHQHLPAAGEVTGLLALMLLPTPAEPPAPTPTARWDRWPSRTGRCGTGRSSLRASS